MAPSSPVIQRHRLARRMRQRPSSVAAAGARRCAAHLTCRVRLRRCPQLGIGCGLPFVRIAGGTARIWMGGQCRWCGVDDDRQRFVIGAAAAVALVAGGSWSAALAQVP